MTYAFTHMGNFLLLLLLTLWYPGSKALSEKIFFVDLDQERMHRSTLMHIYKFLSSLDRAELM